MDGMGDAETRGRGTDDDVSTTQASTRPESAVDLFNRPDVRSYVDDMIAHGSFVHQMATGTLPREKYLRYLSQDAYFLFEFNRAYAMALAKAETVEEQAAYHELIGGVLDELKLHRGACERWGVDLDAATIDPAAEAYVGFLRSLHSRSQTELVAGMVPCMRLYAQLGRRFLHDQESIDVRQSPYFEWFEAYGGSEMESLARRLESLLPPVVDAASAAAYVHAMRLERDFFAAHA
ncbi:Thiaminase-2/PQQ biosynthesis protein C [Ostreococcus tauri]|uniref:Thiaminase-2/PQQ biosynthesis protein C n=1 Tax=Ostreococcus tauri TaxID=70448 RepID=A0A090N4G3_OSTTA|nr:Thiaminase-2/PQQ biosynthesis protein C [Ostreococcus tauri]CEF99818.1 Thiaminase-2/PQQ biosynthesis protein C [Ostreococcus tauri]|eukprot:XP_003082247.2 Thiaminase-2/PQQ biosynthesis protein C [Ostreococcus tauri]